MKTSIYFLAGILSLILMTCRMDSPTQSPLEERTSSRSLTKVGPPPPPSLPAIVGFWGVCSDDAPWLRGHFADLTSEVARLAAGPDGDPASSNLHTWITIGQGAGLTFFLYQFPDTVIMNIGTWGRQWIINRIDSVHSWLKQGQYGGIEVDDIDYIDSLGHHKFNSQEIDSLKSVIQGLGVPDQVYGTASTADDILHHVDVIMADSYSSQTEFKYTATWRPELMSRDV
jgi:hypothetical protein